MLALALFAAALWLLHRQLTSIEGCRCEDFGERYREIADAIVAAAKAR
ncbi:MAG TPA: hypothetical protein VM686_22860 [Polyangiaceae bacterium]|nr:hypothetical protein [Polyangiaceae bacterium]